MNYQILALDLDGTLTNSKKEISKPTLDALIDIQKLGRKVALASGRPTNGITPLADQLHLNEYGGYILPFNGGRIIDYQNSAILYNRALPDGILEPLYQTVLEYKDQGADIVHYTSDSLISGICVNQYSERESRINHMPILKTDDFAACITEPVNKFLVTGEPELLGRVRSHLTAQFKSALYIYNSEPFFLEIMPPGIDKAHSLLKLLTSLGLTSDEMICCGDGYNDITMIETAGLGVAMKNAQPVVLEKADYITDSNDEDGILHVIDKFLR